MQSFDFDEDDPAPPRKAPGAPSALAAGVRVRARAEATRIGPHRVWQTKWYAGVVRRVHDDGSADVDYDDGDSEERVNPSFIRVLAHDRALGGPARKRRRSDAKTEAAGVAEAAGAAEGCRPSPDTPGHTDPITASDHGADSVQDSVGAEHSDADASAQLHQRDEENDIEGDGDGDYNAGEAEPVAAAEASWEVDADVETAHADVFEVEALLDARTLEGGRVQYLVLWGGCATTEASWVDREDILDPSLIAELRDRQAGTRADAKQASDAPPITPAAPPHPTQDASSSGTAAPSLELAAGVRVRARAEATSIGPSRVWQTKWYAGVVRRVHDDGSADVDYDDGDSEERVARRFIKALT